MINKSSEIIITGISGQLGFDCVRVLKEKGFTHVFGLSHSDLDITNQSAVIQKLNSLRPDLVIHCAAYTAVDKAEIEKDEAYKVNVLGTNFIAQACKFLNCTMLYISTDYVFDGKGINFYEIDDPKNGLSVYGKTKSKGEDIVKSLLKKYFIVRISWVFGINGRNFVKTMISLAQSGRKEISVVDDQIGSPTYTYDLAIFLSELILTDKYGIYHATNEGITSWADFAVFIFKCVNIDMKVNYVSTAEYQKMVQNQAKRPLNSRLSKKSIVDNGFELLPSWKDATKRFIKNELGYGE